MKAKLSIALCLLCFAGTSFATPCEEVQAMIEAKIKANGVEKFTLEAVDVDQVKPEDKVVGTCEVGKKKIIYKRGEQTEEH